MSSRRLQRSLSCARPGGAAPEVCSSRLIPVTVILGLALQGRLRAESETRSRVCFQPLTRGSYVSFRKAPRIWSMLLPGEFSSFPHQNPSSSLRHLLRWDCFFWLRHGVYALSVPVARRGGLSG